MILSAQSVPSARSVPCIASLPAGWKLGGVQIDDERGALLARLRPSPASHAVEVTLLPPDRCSVAAATEVPSDEVGVRRYERAEQLPPNLRSTRTYRFPGGCVTYDFAFHGARPARSSPTPTARSRSNRAARSSPRSSAPHHLASVRCRRRRARAVRDGRSTVTFLGASCSRSCRGR